MAVTGDRGVILCDTFQKLWYGHMLRESEMSLMRDKAVS